MVTTEGKTEKARTSALDLWFGTKQVLHRISFPVYRNSVTAVIGPSGCGKSTLLRCFNRMNDFIPATKIRGEILLDGVDVHRSGTDVYALRMRVGMVFQKPNPFPKSVFENVAFGLRIQEGPQRETIPERVETSLRSAGLWDEVKDRLHDSALSLSGGQQQRLCIARALATQPDVLLLDEPTSALDPRATSGIEDLIRELRRNYTLVIVTHNMQQAARVSDTTAFLYEGVLVEFGETAQIFARPKERRTEDYVTGRFG